MRKYFGENKGYFFGKSFSLEHRAAYGTANSVSDEKGSDKKKNNTSKYNHDYYMRNKDKWADNNSSKDSSDGDDVVSKLSDMSGMKEESCKRLLELAKTKGFDDPQFKDLLDSLSEGDSDQSKKMLNLIRSNVDSTKSSEKEFDIDAAARDIIRGNYGNGKERKKALGEDYAMVQKRVNELMKQMKGSTSDTKSESASSEKKEEKTDKSKIRSFGEVKTDYYKDKKKK